MGSYTDEPSAPQHPYDLLFRMATAVVFVGIGMWAGYELSAVSYAAQVFLLLVPGILFPGALLLFADTTLRVLIFVLGLVFGLATQTFMNLGGPDSPGLVIPWLGYCTAAGAVVAELVMFVRRLLRGMSKPQES